MAGDTDRTYEGDWYVADSTNNNTGEREVYAFQLYLKRGNPNFVTFTIRCSEGEPTVFIEWEGLTFPDQAVISIAPVDDPRRDPVEIQYVFAKSTNPDERGLRASAATSERIVSSFDGATEVTVAAHVASGTRVIALGVEGAARAWDRVARHCPAPTMALPPL